MSIIKVPVNVFKFKRYAWKKYIFRGIKLKIGNMIPAMKKIILMAHFGEK